MLTSTLTVIYLSILSDFRYQQTNKSSSSSSQGYRRSRNTVALIPEPGGQKVESGEKNRGRGVTGAGHGASSRLFSSSPPE